MFEKAREVFGLLGVPPLKIQQSDWRKQVLEKNATTSTAITGYSNIYANFFSLNRQYAVVSRQLFQT